MTNIVEIHRKEYQIASGADDKIIVSEAPGCLHYLGDHGQFKDALYFSSGINRTVQVAISLRKDSSLRFFSAASSERKRTTLANMRYKREDRWSNHIKTALSLFIEAGCAVKGINVTVFSDIPKQLALASAQALEIASALVFRRFFLPNLSDRELLMRLCAAHSEFCETESRIIEYLAIMNARKNHFLVIDEEKLEVSRIKNPFSKYKIMLFDSRVPPIDIDSELQLRYEDITKGLEILSKKRRGFSFKDYTVADMQELMGALNEEVRRRCLFVVKEIARIRDAERVLGKNDPDAFAHMIFHSHEGLRDMYEVSCPETDWLVKRAQETQGIIGSRLTGMGFGGATYAFVREDVADEYKKKFDDYERIFGFRPVSYDLQTATGARILPQ